jgi:hypothetical protein
MLKRVINLKVSPAHARRLLSTNPAKAPAEPVLAQIYGGLKDQDRIFTNLYGEKVNYLNIDIIPSSFFCRIGD